MPIPRWTDEVDKDADETYRYWLLRAAPGGRSGRRLVVVGFNPADGGQVDVDAQDDPTIRIVEQWASGLHAKTKNDPEREQFGEVLYLNLFAWRHGDAAELDRAISDRGYDYVVGSRNRDALLEGTSRPGDVVVAMWGNSTRIKENQGAVVRRRGEVLDLLECDLSCVGEIAPGMQPEHGFRWNFGDGRRYPWRIQGRFDLSFGGGGYLVAD